jgi:hypothetical protein
MLATAPLWERIVVLAPVIIVGVGLIVGVFILLGRAFAQSLRESGHKRAILAGLGLVVAAVVVLTYLGVNLPRE